MCPWDAQAATQPPGGDLWRVFPAAPPAESAAEFPDLALTRTSSSRALARELLGDQPVKVDAEGEARHGHQRQRAERGQRAATAGGSGQVESF